MTLNLDGSVICSVELGYDLEEALNKFSIENARYSPISQYLALKQER